MQTLDLQHRSSQGSNLVELYAANTQTKHITMVSCTLLFYDLLVTLPHEFHYVWGSRISFGRIAFHINRLCGPLLFAVYVPTLFTYHLNREVCVRIGIFVAILSGITKVGVGSVLIVRTWAVYGIKTWMLITLCLCYAATAIPGYVLFYTQKRYIDNPYPDFISGCTFKTGPQLKISYLAPFLFQTLIMIMTGYKAWSFSREQQSVPIMRGILYNEMKAYFGFVILLMTIEICSMIRATKTAIIGSLLFTAMLSLMCGRILLHGFSLNCRKNVCTTYHEANEIHIVRLEPLSTSDTNTRTPTDKARDEEEGILRPR